MIGSRLMPPYKMVIYVNYYFTHVGYMCSFELINMLDTCDILNAIIIHVPRTFMQIEKFDWVTASCQYYLNVPKL